MEEQISTENKMSVLVSRIHAISINPDLSTARKKMAYVDLIKGHVSDILNLLVNIQDTSLNDAEIERRMKENLLEPYQIFMTMEGKFI